MLNMLTSWSTSLSGVGKGSLERPSALQWSFVDFYLMSQLYADSNTAHR